MKKQNNNGNFNYYIYGRHAVLAALENSERQKLLLLLEKNKYCDLIGKYQKFINIKVVDKITNDLNYLSPHVHQGIVLQTEILKQINFDKLQKKLAKKTTDNILILDQINDPQNIGAIIRSALAFGIETIIVPDCHTPHETAAMVKTASGAFEKINFIRVKNISTTIEELKKIGYWIFGFSSFEANIMNNGYRNYDKIAMVFGSEDQGIRKLIKSKCDILLKINISDQVESLNVSNAVAIAAHFFSSK